MIASMSIKERLIGYLVYLIVTLFRWTYRVRFFGIEHRRLAESAHPKGSAALALWHEHLWASIVAHAGQRIAPLASLSKDGDIVTYVLERLGYETVRGSSSRRGAEARDELVELGREGYSLAITVDGPRGPRRRVKGGIVDVSRRTGMRIVPLVSVASRPYIFQKSWDRFQVPLPFSKIAVRYASPIEVPPDTQGLAFGEVKNAVKRALDEAEALAEQDLAAWSSRGR